MGCLAVLFALNEQDVENLLAVEMSGLSVKERSACVKYC